MFGFLQHEWDIALDFQILTPAGSLQIRGDGFCHVWMSSDTVTVLEHEISPKHVVVLLVSGTKYSSSWGMEHTVVCGRP